MIYQVFKKINLNKVVLVFVKQISHTPQCSVWHSCVHRQNYKRIHTKQTKPGLKLLQILNSPNLQAIHP